MKKTEEKTRRRRYRLNVKRFASVVLVIGIVAAMIVLTSGALERDEPEKLAMAPGPETVLAAHSPVQTGIDEHVDVLKDRVIVVDAGHGGFDPGTSSASGVREDVLNLAIAQQFKTLLEDNGAKVIMTRSDDNALAQTNVDDLAERRRIIAQSGADIVVSIHMNWYEDSQVYGPVVLFMPGSVQGKTLAEMVQQSLNSALQADGRARSESLFILKSGNQPSILVECGYLSNAEEENKLQQPDHQQKVAKAICEGIISFLSE